MIAWHPISKEIHLIDVKTVNQFLLKSGRKAFYPTKLSTKQEEAGVRRITYYPDNELVVADF